MLFLVISTPAAERPSDMQAQRRLYWPWAEDKIERGLIRHVYARTGRGAVAVFDVDSNEVLHRLLNEWADIVPAHFDIHPLIDPDAIQTFLHEVDGG